MKYYFNESEKITMPNAGKSPKIRGAVVRELSDHIRGKSFSSREEYLATIKGIEAIARRHIFYSNSHLHAKEIEAIKKGHPLTERTKWGGVSLKKVDVDNDFIKKLLVIEKFGKLGFEYHRRKHEHLEVVEGICIALYSNHKSRGWSRGKTSFRIAAKGDRFDFMPYDEHGILALTDCVIEEKSDNHLDDLVFVYDAN